MNLVSRELAGKMNQTSGEYPHGTSEFNEVELTAVSSQFVTAPSVAESPVSMECKLVQIVRHGNNNIVIRYIQDTLYVISGKWKLPIINGHRRYREIAKNIPGITFKMLSKELREMELNKLLERSVHEGPPEVVDYLPTRYCESLYPLLEQMINWAKHHRTVIR